MQSLVLPPPTRQALAQAAMTYRYGDEHQPVTTADILTPRRREDYGKDLWSTYQTIPVSYTHLDVYKRQRQWLLIKTE